MNAPPNNNFGNNRHGGGTPNQRGRIRILICDDNTPLRQLLARMTAKSGYEVTETASGRELLAFLNAGQAFDLILLDVLMEDMSGFEVLREIRQIRGDRTTKICMVTGKSDPHDVAKAVKLGANDYIVKPIYEEILLPKIEKLVGVRPQVEFTRLAVKLRAILPVSNITPDVVITEIAEEGFSAFATAAISVDTILPLKVPTLDNMIDFGGPLHCRVTHCDRRTFGKYHLKLEFVGIAEAARSQLRALAQRGQELADIELPSKAS